MEEELQLIKAWVPGPFLVLAKIWIVSISDQVDFASDEWEVIEWRARPGNKKRLSLRFKSIQNPELRLLGKLYIASRRINSRISSGAASCMLSALYRLDAILGQESVQRLNNSHFYVIEEQCQAVGFSGRNTMLANLQTFAGWVQTRLGLRLLYKAPKGRATYGRGGTEEGRLQKLLPTEIIRDLFNLATHPELSIRDRFFLSAIVVNTALGCRINELTCLPVNCLVRQQDDWVIKYFPEKGGRLFFRPIPQDMYPSVKAALDFIAEHTSEGRELVRKLRTEKVVDWRKVIKSSEALSYYARKFSAEWISSNNLFTPRGSYYRTTKQFIDAVGLLDRCGSFRAAAAYLGTSLRQFKKLVCCQLAMKDKVFLYEKNHREICPLTCEVNNWKGKLRIHPHAVQLSLLEEAWQLQISGRREIASIINHILDEALLCQLKGEEFKFIPDPELESGFILEITPTIRNGDGAVLNPEDSLFVVPRNFLGSYSTRTNQYSLVSDAMFSNWLINSTNGDDSLFKKFNIMDPRTGTIAAFNWHDIRHWLNTVYKQGGLSDAQVNLILGRADASQAKVYDHTPALSRSRILERMMQQVRDNKAVGLIQTTFNNLKIENRQTAEEYLVAAVRVINPMPHGGCAHNLALGTCQHHLSCLVQGPDGKPCGELVVDSQDSRQYNELLSLSRDANAMQAHIINAGGENSPQYKHFYNVGSSADLLLAEIFKKSKYSMAG